MNEGGRKACERNAAGGGPECFGGATTPMRARTEARPAPHQPGTMAAVVPAAANPAAALQPSHAGRQPVSREEDTPLVTASVVFIVLFSLQSCLV